MMIFNKIVGAFFLYSLFALSSETQARISPGEGNMLKISSGLNSGKTLTYVLEEGYDQITMNIRNYRTYPDSSSLAPYIRPARSSLTRYTKYGRPILSPPPAPGSQGPPVPRPNDYIINSSPMISSHEYQSSRDKIPVNGAITFKPMPPQDPSPKAGPPFGPDEI